MKTLVQLFLFSLTFFLVLQILTWLWFEIYFILLIVIKRRILSILTASMHVFSFYSSCSSGSTWHPPKESHSNWSPIKIIQLKNNTTLLILFGKVMMNIGSRKKFCERESIILFLVLSCNLAPVRKKRKNAWIIREWSIELFFLTI